MSKLRERERGGCDLGQSNVRQQMTRRDRVRRAADDDHQNPGGRREQQGHPPEAAIKNELQRQNLVRDCQHFPLKKTITNEDDAW